MRYWLETVTDDFGLNGSLGVRAATKSEVLARLDTGLHLKASLIICGHTHIPRIVSVTSPTGGHLITVINPGSVGLPAYDDEYPFIHHIENGSYHARYAIAERKATGWQVERRRPANTPCLLNYYRVSGAQR